MRDSASLVGMGAGAGRGALALLYSLGSRTRHGTMHTAATMPARMRPWVSLGRRPSSSAVTHMEVKARQARTCGGRAKGKQQGSVMGHGPVRSSPQRTHTRAEREK